MKRLLSVFPALVLILLLAWVGGCSTFQGKLSQIKPGMSLAEVNELIGEPEQEWDLEPPRGKMLRFLLCASAEVMGENYFVELDDESKVVWSGQKLPE